MGWKCITCKRVVIIDTSRMGFACPYCNGKVFSKERPTTTRKIKAI
jgi:DNA-directed RNA polymerase subunit RPC12/RpoP